MLKTGEILSVFSVFPLRSNVVRFPLVVCALAVLTGCQQLFHAPDAPLKGQTVTVSMTVPETPPPAAKPLPQQPEQLPVQRPVPRKSLDKRLLPTQDTFSESPLAATSAAAVTPSKPVRDAVLQADTVLVDKTVVEDLVLRGMVLIKGALVVAPQATLRIEPGTVLRFTPLPGSSTLPRLVVQGRIVVSGTSQKPVLFGPALSTPLAGDWGGIVLLNSEKKNSLDHCRIEGAQTGLAAHFSNVTGRGLIISRSQTGVVLHDSEAHLQGSIISRCDVGCSIADSELDLRDSTIRENRQGCVGVRSSLNMANVNLLRQAQEGLLAEQCRFRISGSLFAENRSGIRLTNGDGRLFLCRFQNNHDYGAELLGVRVRISNSSFVANAGYGVLLDNAHGSIVGSVFTENGKANLLNQGRVPFAALLNWWGSADEKQVAAGIHDVAPGAGGSVLAVEPFLKTRPATAP